MKTILGLGLGLLVITVAWLWIASLFVSKEPALDSVSSVDLNLSWTLLALPENTEGMPKTKLTLNVGSTIREIGEFDGSCAQVPQESLVDATELSAVVCWWAGGGKEIGIFESNGVRSVMVGDLDEGTAEEGGFRGDFRALPITI